MGEEVQSEKVCCATARSWARFIGWFTIILCVIEVFGLIRIVLDLCGVIDLDFEAHKGSSNPESGNAVAAFLRDPVVELVILTGLFILTFAGGIVLVKGVRQGSSSKLMCWLIIEGVSFALWILDYILKIKSWTYEEVVVIFILIFITLFCIWVVNIHRKELKRPVGKIGAPI